jgi:hypothetical protein
MAAPIVQPPKPGAQPVPAPTQQPGVQYSFWGDIKDVGKSLLFPIGDLLKGEPCSIAHKIPGIKDVVKNYGCSPAGKAALASYLTAQVPALGPFSTMLADKCLCAGDTGGAGPYQGGFTPPPPASPFGGKGTMIGLAALGIGLIVFLSKKKSSSAQPQVVVVSADAGKK